MSEQSTDLRETVRQRAERGDYVGCIAGAVSFAECREGLAAAGLTDVEITPTHPVADGMYSAIVRAVKPSGVAEESGSAPETGTCCGVSACCSSDERAAGPSDTATRSFPARYSSVSRPMPVRYPSGKIADTSSGGGISCIFTTVTQIASSRIRAFVRPAESGGASFVRFM